MCAKHAWKKNTTLLKDTKDSERNVMSVGQNNILNFLDIFVSSQIEL